MGNIIMPDTIITTNNEGIENSRPAKILVVEDDVSLLHGIRSILQLDEYEVLIAENGIEALRIMYEQTVPPDLIISDIMMPQMDGNQLLEEVRKEAKWIEIPFIFLTAKSGRGDVQQGVAMGADDYITKPYDPEYLRVTVRSKLKRKEHLGRIHADNVEQIKRNILTILNHEFRTPLTFVVAYADMLNISTDLNSLENGTEMLNFLKGISSGAERLRQLIENFITLVEMETGEAEHTLQLRKSIIKDPATFLKTVCDDVLDDTNERCTITVDDNTPPFYADDTYLARALRHLIENAAKFSEKDTPINIHVRYEENTVVISVRDEGRGIPEDEHDKIWEMFYQVKRDIYEDQGAGSGLAIVKGIVALHGGNVGVESAIGEGSTFTIRLPIG